MSVTVDRVLANLTTLRLGGPAGRLVEATSEAQIVGALVDADAAGDPLLLLGGGSNVVIADAGFPGTVIQIANRGVSTESAGDRVQLTAAAGEPWAELVARAMTDGLAGLECLAGIPGSVGATPIQNVGAYGQQVSDTIVSVRVYDRRAGRIVDLQHGECAFGYRSSVFRGLARHVVLGVTFELERSSLARPIVYPDLARSLEVEPDSRRPLPEVVEAVLALRRQKGMVLDPGDPESVSAGSFFVNPVMSRERFAQLEWRSVERLGPTLSPPRWPRPDGNVKTSAAWLIEHAGFTRGYGAGRVGISNKHMLALVNRGGASTAELIALAREIRAQVQRVFGVELSPEPTLVGVEL
ncbi:MAG: UDP-N-acetylmuramate dehydrogenase [Solirubrobacteraceae bacterium]